jgi:enoyl-CoA hydratase/carnithine racemase
MSTDPLIVRTAIDGVLTLTLNRPQTRNALSLGMLQALLGELSYASQEASVRVVVLAGAGPGFCAGHDLKEMRSENFDSGYAKALFSECAEVMLAIVRLSKPVIAQVHGTATAAGCQLVATCDLAVAAQDARFSTPGVNIGLFCSTPMVALSRNINRKHAMRMLLTGDFIDANTALEVGLVSDVVPTAELPMRTAALAGAIASKSHITLAIGKRAFYRQSELSLEDAYTYACDVMADNLSKLDAQEGIGAFIEKRNPVWCGQ